MGYSVFPAPVASSSKTYKEKYFTSSTTWTVPDGVNYADVIVVGGGGGGGFAGSATTCYGGGGGGGNVISKTISLTTSGITVVVGAGGLSSTSSTISGGHGGYSLIGNDSEIWHNFIADFRGNVPFNSTNQDINVNAQGLTVNQQLSKQSTYNNTLGHAGWGQFQTSSSTTIDTKRFFVSESTNYTIYYRAFNNSSTSTITYNMAYFNTSGSEISNQNLSTYTMPTSVNTTTRNFTTPAGAVTARLRISSTGTGDTTQISYIAVTKTSLGSAIYTRDTIDETYEFYNDNATLWRIKRETSAFATGGGGGGSRLSDQSSQGASPTFGETTGGSMSAATAPTSPNRIFGACGTGAGSGNYVDRTLSKVESGTAISQYNLFTDSFGWNRYNSLVSTAGRDDQSFSIPLIKPGKGLLGYGYGGYGQSLPNGSFTGLIVPEGAIGYAASNRQAFAHQPNTGHGGHARLTGTSANEIAGTNGSSGLVIVRWYE